MKNISLKRATLKDADIVLAIEKTASGLKTFFPYTTEKEIADFITKSAVFLIEKEGIIVGLIDYEDSGSGNAHIGGLVVKPEFQNQGIAKQATEIILHELSEKKRVDLTVHPHNKYAIMLYLSLGFIIESWKDNYFGDGEPRLIMVYKK